VKGDTREKTPVLIRGLREIAGDSVPLHRGIPLFYARKKCMYIYKLVYAWKIQDHDIRFDDVVLECLGHTSGDRSSGSTNTW